MKIALISTGEEILTGDIVDTNSAWLAELLSDAGFKLSWHVTVGDAMEELVDAFELASQRSDVCIVNGGLGPTTDDLSAEAAAQWKHEGLKELSVWIAKLEDFYASRNRVMPESNRKQAHIPESGEMVDNPVGTACGFKVSHNQCDLYFTPGVPFEFKTMVKDQILPALVAEQHESMPQLKRWLTFGLSESLLADWLDPIELPQGAVLGYRSSMPTIEIKLRVPASCADSDVKALEKAISNRLDPFVFSTGKQRMAQRVQALMLERGVTLSTAESCTGGMVADWLISEAGSSAYFQRGYVTYSNQAKQDDLGVPKEIITEHGAVSIPVVEAMAEGARDKAQTDFALATSGIAGPQGGSDDKPVGTVAFALATPDGVFSQMLVLPNRGRTLVRKVSTAVALDMLRRYLTNQPIFTQYSGSKILYQGQ
ncbi:CinA family nicotinamide mononucleotide deamidase-related protein [Echinimonas agarilytica]|nr:CinA family nicotinamide mononucleotide deamidase-related protein [Echinimonas agarilytica]